MSQCGYCGLKRIVGYQTLSHYLPAPLMIRQMAWRYWVSGEREVRILRRLVRPRSNSVDVGAASGLYSYHLSRLSDCVFAYEPNPEWVKWLSRAVPRNVSVFDVALSNNAGRAVLSIPPPSLESLKGDLTLRCPEAASIEKQFEGVPCDRISVITRRLDEYKLRNIGFIKIDVEGHELAVLEGAEETLKNCRPVLLVEIDQQHIKRDVCVEFERIESKNYEGRFFLDGRWHSLNEFNPQIHQPQVEFAGRQATYVNNFIFMPK